MSASRHRPRGAGARQRRHGRSPVSARSSSRRARRPHPRVPPGGRVVRSSPGALQLLLPSQCKGTSNGGRALLANSASSVPRGTWHTRKRSIQCRRPQRGSGDVAPSRDRTAQSGYWCPPPLVPLPSPQAHVRSSTDSSSQCHREGRRGHRAPSSAPGPVARRTTPQVHLGRSRVSTGRLSHCAPPSPTTPLLKIPVEAPPPPGVKPNHVPHDCTGGYRHPAAAVRSEFH